MAPKDEPNEEVQTVHRAFDIVESLYRMEGATFPELVSDVDMAKSTVYRHVTSLDSQGYLVEDDGIYYPSLRFLEIGQFSRTRLDAFQIAQDKVEELALKTEERAQFIVPENNRGVYVHRSVGDHAVSADTRVGLHVPLHASAAGLAILSHFPDHRVQTIIESEGLEEVTSKTITDPDTLTQELAEIRDRGYSINDQGFVEGLRAMGVPVLATDDRVIGGLSVSGPTNRMKGAWFNDELPNLLLGSANELELRIAHS